MARMYAGGSKDFDESTGKRTGPKKGAPAKRKRKPPTFGAQKGERPKAKESGKASIRKSAPKGGYGKPKSKVEDLRSGPKRKPQPAGPKKGRTPIKKDAERKPLPAGRKRKPGTGKIGRPDSPGRKRKPGTGKIGRPSFGGRKGKPAGTKKGKPGMRYAAKK